MLELHQHVELRQLVMGLQRRFQRAFVFEPECRSAGVMQPFFKIGASGLGLRANTTFMAPHSECPHTTMFATLRTSMAYRSHSPRRRRRWRSLPRSPVESDCRHCAS